MPIYFYSLLFISLLNSLLGIFRTVDVSFNIFFCLCFSVLLNNFVKFLAKGSVNPLSSTRRAWFEMVPLLSHKKMPCTY